MFLQIGWCLSKQEIISIGNPSKRKKFVTFKPGGFNPAIPPPPTKNYAVFSKGKEMGRWQFRYSIEVCVDTKVAAYVILKKICFCHTKKLHMQ